MFALDILNENVNPSTVQGLGESYEPGMVGLLEMEQDNMRDGFILESALLVASSRHAQLISEGASTQAENLSENMFKTAYNKIVELLKKMWARMKDFFKNVRLFFDKLAMKESKFVEKYEKEISQITKVKVSGYKFDFSKLTVGGAWTNIKKVIDTEKGRISELDGKDKAAIDKLKVTEGDKFKDALAGAVVSGAKAGTLDKKIQQAFGMKEGKGEVEYNGTTLVKILKGLGEAKNVVNEEQEGVDDAYKAAIDEVEKLEDDNKEKDGATFASKIASNVKLGADFINKVAGIKIALLKKECGQAKAAAYKGIAADRKSNTKKMNSVSESFEVGDILGSILNY